MTNERFLQSIIVNLLPLKNALNFVLSFQRIIWIEKLIQFSKMP